MLILLDANLENIEQNNQITEKFVMNSEFKIGNRNGIFEANKEEIRIVNKIATAYDYDNPEINQFPTYDGKTMKWYDRNDKYLGEYTPNYNTGINMNELNKYEFYSLNYSNAEILDEVSDFVNDITKINDYNDVKEYLSNKWDNIENISVIDYPELNKKVSLKITDERIEVRVFKNNKQCYGEYWQIVPNNAK